jgi:hypothetical protein
MSKKIKLQFLLVLLSLVTPLVMFSQDIDPPPPYEEIDPPPAAPIDDSIAILVVAGLVFAAYYFYKTNIKMEEK